MSLVLNPATGKLIKAGSEEHMRLLGSPTWRKHFTSPTVQTGTITPIGVPTALPLSTLAPSPIVSPTTSATLTTGVPLPRSPTVLLPTVSPSMIPVRATPPAATSLPVAVPVPSPVILPVSTPVVTLPTVSTNNPGNPKKRQTVSTVEVWGDKMMPNDKHLKEILSMPVYDVPALEEVLKRTRQPSIRADLERMISEQKKGGRGGRTRGWRARSPKKGRDRHQLMRECGRKCFLDPDNEGFPICPKCQLGDGKCICAIDCGGVTSAKVRASQWGYPKIRAKADEILKRKCLVASYYMLA